MFFVVPEWLRQDGCSVQIIDSDNEGSSRSGDVPVIEYTEAQFDPSQPSEILMGDGAFVLRAENSEADEDDEPCP